jgi:hypothetical protein
MCDLLGTPRHIHPDRIFSRLQNLELAVHEEAESQSGRHEEALARAPQTDRPISERAR